MTHQILESTKQQATLTGRQRRAYRDYLYLVYLRLKPVRLRDGTPCPRRNHNLHLAEVAFVLRHWLVPQVVGNESVICHACIFNEYRVYL
ncbi:unnamed protein product [Arctia plantaginis]|uniref:Uncharacterized protein n=1 Tax=Arctia plantaginis TaxID=874455 RepID=A0A8S1AR79_ARCPL|nr:unnamed protein product [Arctia plantaginis]